MTGTPGSARRSSRHARAVPAGLDGALTPAPAAFSVAGASGSVDDFIKDGRYDFLAFSTQLEAYLVGRGASAFSDYDKVIMESPRRHRRVRRRREQRRPDRRDSPVGVPYARTRWRTRSAPPTSRRPGRPLPVRVRPDGEQFSGAPEDGARGGDPSPTSTATASSTSTSTRATPGGVAIRSIEALLTYKDTLEVHVCRARSRAGVQRIVLNTLRSEPFVRRPREMAYTNAAVFDATEGRPREALQAAQDRGPVDGHVPIHRPRLRTADAHARRDGYGPAREKGDRR